MQVNVKGLPSYFCTFFNILHMLHHKTSARNTKIITDAKYR